MKDVELVAQLLLLTESGIETYSQEDLERAYSHRDEEWEDASRVEDEFRTVLGHLADWAPGLLDGDGRRLRNQADFYSLYGACLERVRIGDKLEKNYVVGQLEQFMQSVSDEVVRQENGEAKRYYEAARSASNDVAQRRDRVAILAQLMAPASA